MTARQAVVSQVWESYLRIGKPAKVLLALSGGADSMALLLILIELSQEFGFELSCVHVNHHLRTGSTMEAEWLSDYVSNLRIPIVVKDVVVPSTGNMEDMARKVRYQALIEAKKQNNASVIALAHHGEDQAETLLMHLMRGAGPSTLCGMRELQNTLWRPLLCTTKTDLQSLLLTSDTPFIEDESNRDESLLRNLLRMRIIPQLETIWPNASLHMARTASLMEDEVLTWEKEELEFLNLHSKQSTPFCFVMRSALAAVPVNFQKRLMRRFLLQAGVKVEHSHLQKVQIALTESDHKEINLPLDYKVWFGKDRVHLIGKQDKCVEWKPLVMAQDQGGYGNGILKQAFPCELIKNAVVRCAQSGDTITPFGMEGKQGIFKYLSARRIDQPFRKHWPVFASGKDVLWAIGLGPSNKARVTPETKDRVVLCFSDLLPHQLEGRRKE